MDEPYDDETQSFIDEDTRPPPREREPEYIYYTNPPPPQQIVSQPPPIEELVKLADEQVKAEIEERQKQREKTLE